MLNFVVALSAEANPLVNHFHLEPETDSDRFRTYRSGDNSIWLVISGVGRDSAAAAAAFLAARTRASRQTAWLNVGVGGQRDLPVGTPLLAHTITDDVTESSWHPPIIFEPFCETAPVRTVQEPLDHYPTDEVYEMEASGFYAIARQVSNPGMVHVLKVISDNSLSPIGEISRAKVIQLIRSRLGEIENTVTSLRELAV